MTYRERLTFHGQSESMCKWVIEKYKDNQLYENNQTVKQWVKDSEECLSNQKSETYENTTNE